MATRREQELKDALDRALEREKQLKAQLARDMSTILVIDCVTNQLIGSYELIGSTPFRISKLIRTRFGCDEDHIDVLNDSIDGCDVTVHGEIVARIDVVEIRELVH